MSWTWNSGTRVWKSEIVGKNVTFTFVCTYPLTSLLNNETAKSASCEPTGRAWTRRNKQFSVGACRDWPHHTGNDGPQKGPSNHFWVPSQQCRYWNCAVNAPKSGNISFSVYGPIFSVLHRCARWIPLGSIKVCHVCVTLLVPAEPHVYK